MKNTQFFSFTKVELSLLILSLLIEKVEVNTLAPSVDLRHIAFSQLTISLHVLCLQQGIFEKSPTNKNKRYSDEPVWSFQIGPSQLLTHGMAKKVLLPSDKKSLDNMFFILALNSTSVGCLDYVSFFPPVRQCLKIDH